MAKTAPVISVVMPAYNSEAYVAEAVDSVLAQDGAPPYEVIVIDDGSTDGTAEVLRGYGGEITVIRQANAGVSAARNRGLAEAAGRWVFFADSDDVILPHALRTLMAAAEQNPAADVVYGDQAMLHPDGRVEPITRTAHPQGPSSAVEAFKDMPFGMGAGLIRRDLILRVGAFDTSLHLAEDYEFLCRLAVEGHFVYVPGVVRHYRRRPGQATGRLMTPTLSRLAVQRGLMRHFRRCGIRVPKAVRWEAMEKPFLIIATKYFHRRHVPEVAPLLLAAARMKPRDLRLWAYWALSHLPRGFFRLVDRLRRVKA